jgi:hypothetical protein
MTIIMIGVGDLVQRTGDGHTNRVLHGRMIEGSGGAVCDLHLARVDEKREFLGGASKPRSIVCQLFGLKTTRTVFRFDLKTDGDDFSRFGLKTCGNGFSRFGLKTGGLSFSVWALKPTATV